MNDRDSLWYLINGLLNDAYDINIFCDEFTRIFDLEVNYNELNEREKKDFKDLCELTARFSDDFEELRIPNMYVSELEIRKKVQQIVDQN